MSFTRNSITDAEKEMIIAEALETPAGRFALSRCLGARERASNQPFYNELYYEREKWLTECPELENEIHEHYNAIEIEFQTL